MLNNKKIRLMTKLAIFETKDGKEDIRLSKYYKTDYVRLQVLKSIVSTTVGYLLILALIFLYKSEYIIKNAVSLDYKTLGSYILGIYIILITIYGLGSLAWYSFKYEASRKKLKALAFLPYRYFSFSLEV
jgi:hypothetical protein